jgi:hypothetical protein
MIPYEELVAALAQWRQRQGLPAGPADYLGEPQQAGYDYTPSETAGGGYGASVPYGTGGAYGEDVVELSDDMMDSVVEEQSSPFSVDAMETADDGSQSLAVDTQDEDMDAYLDSAIPLEPPKPEPEPEPASSGRRKRKK